LTQSEDLAGQGTRQPDGQTDRQTDNGSSIRVPDEEVKKKKKEGAPKKRRERKTRRDGRGVTHTHKTRFKCVRVWTWRNSQTVEPAKQTERDRTGTGRNKTPAGKGKAREG
jgi:hypothetical protein